MFDQEIVLSICLYINRYSFSKIKSLSSGPNEEALLERALAMSLGGDESSTAANTVSSITSAGGAPDFSAMSEEEQIAFAMQMSMQDARKWKYFSILKLKSKNNILRNYFKLFF